MSSEKNKQEKSELHARNKNRERYDLKALLIAVPDLKAHIKPNKFGDDTVDFADPKAVKLLNTALLKHYYGIKYWEFPDENLCPPIPGRADYIHNLADLLKESNFGRMPAGEKITCLDTGTGASCIYPLLGVTEYDWRFIGSDIDPKSLESAKKIVEANGLDAKIELRLQKDKSAIFKNIICQDEKIDITLCNPPFHSSAEDAQKGAKRKVQNLTDRKVESAQLNFSGVSNELIYDGGEHQFVHTMIAESKKVAQNVYWFSTLVSKQSNLKGIYKALEILKAVQVKTIPMGTGNKSTRVVAWSFLSKEEQKQWREFRWK
ncbi:23S rRNA (adenine(1618)-N(6))-methyltransferase RlmF [Flavobacterium sp. DG1-102-2]|uniref:23S rRNA (adenine(1618)-N(6))-methyltransferase RlmF n=1 Tax=Flavobacterium sp. DG1-102-2 TaxID=3081663 RepID=UPI00294A9115|nr:23S rRNA (adenine(1618)-N(6))-methyltransferase RlmF [Flavobacterium sp. DG1-102-2]MDV6169239.1 23S rRNA (adenine(1618)-N(6))-methyltransferase RlmF [Flavobacterium sp. DG1-102-2]